MTFTLGLFLMLSLVCSTMTFCSQTSFYQNCWIRRLPGLLVDMHESVRRGALILQLLREESGQKCSRSCCLTPNFACNMAVFHYNIVHESGNCFLLRCLGPDSCIMRSSGNVILYNLTRGPDPDLLVFGKHFTSNVRVWPPVSSRLNSSEPLASDRRQFNRPLPPALPPTSSSKPRAVVTPKTASTPIFFFTKATKMASSSSSRDVAGTTSISLDTSSTYFPSSRHLSSDIFTSSWKYFLRPTKPKQTFANHVSATVTPLSSTDLDISPSTTFLDNPDKGTLDEGVQTSTTFKEQVAATVYTEYLEGMNVSNSSFSDHLNISTPIQPLNGSASTSSIENLKLSQSTIPTDLINSSAETMFSEHLDVTTSLSVSNIVTSSATAIENMGISTMYRPSEVTLDVYSDTKIDVHPNLKDLSDPTPTSSSTTITESISTSGSTASASVVPAEVPTAETHGSFSSHCSTTNTPTRAQPLTFPAAPANIEAGKQQPNDTKGYTSRNQSIGESSGSSPETMLKPSWHLAATALLVPLLITSAALLACCSTVLLAVGCRGKKKSCYRTTRERKRGSMRLVKYVIVRESGNF